MVNSTTRLPEIHRREFTKYIRMSCIKFVVMTKNNILIALTLYKNVSFVREIHQYIYTTRNHFALYLFFNEGIQLTSFLRLAIFPRPSQFLSLTDLSGVICCTSSLLPNIILWVWSKSLFMKQNFESTK